jgi:hypothetical protein
MQDHPRADAVKDIYEKIEEISNARAQIKRESKQSNQSHQSHEVRDPHGILHILKSMRSRL